MEGNTMSAADIAAVTRPNMYGYGYGDGCGFGGNNLIWLIAFLFLSGGFGSFGGYGRDRAATTEDLASGFNFSGINNKLNELSAGQANINQNLGNAICQLGYQDAQHTYELASKIDNCCCNTQLGIQGAKFDMANYASAIQMNDTANTQKVLDKLCQMEINQKDALIAQQGARIAALEADARMCGIPRINTYAYGVYPYPTCNNGCTNI